MKKQNKYYGKGLYTPNSEISENTKKETIKLTKDEHLNEWYSTYYDGQFFVDCDGEDYLVNFYSKRNKYKQRFDMWFKDLKLDGNLHLDYGFSTGKTLYWLSKKYNNITIDSFDFNENCKNIINYIKNLNPQVRDLTIQDSSKLKYPKESYDSITAIDFYEHTPYKIMVESLKISYKILKKGGTIHIYVGKTISSEHINLISDSKTIELCESLGFKLTRKLNELLSFSK